jgi:hypothetical protein
MVDAMVLVRLLLSGSLTSNMASTTLSTERSVMLSHSVAFYVMLATATLSQADIRVALDSVVS